MEMETDFSTSGSHNLQHYPKWHPGHSQADRAAEFLRDQQEDIVLALRSEIERLRRENNDLQYRLIMASRASLRRQSSEVVTADQQPRREQLQQMSAAQTQPDVSELLREISNLRKQLLAKESQQQQQQQQVDEDTHAELSKKRTVKPQQPARSANNPSHQSPTDANVATVPISSDAPSEAGLSALVEQQQLAGDPSAPALTNSDEASLAECQQIIKRLLRRVDQQTAEINRLRVAISTANSRLVQQQQHYNIRLNIRPSQQPGTARREDSNLSRLPPLATAMGGRAADLRRRAQAVRVYHHHQQHQLQQQQQMQPPPPPPPPLPIQTQIHPLPRPASKRAL